MQRQHSTRLLVTSFNKSIPTRKSNCARRARSRGAIPTERSIDAELILHDIQRPLLDLFVDSADVLAEDADGDELHAAEKEDADEKGEEAAAGLAVQDEEQDHVDERGEE